MNFQERVQKHWTPDKLSKVTNNKKYKITPVEHGELLRVLGILNSDASMSADAVRKYKQINHMLLVIEPYLINLQKRFETVTILDCCCGSSFVTLLLATYFTQIVKHKVNIIGIDINKKVIDKSIINAEKLGFSNALKFTTTPLQEFNFENSYRELFGENSKVTRPNATIALHACDIATDLSIGTALANKSDFIAVAPCCQKELFNKFEQTSKELINKGLESLFNTPHLRREIGALLTDTMRFLLMRASGYEVTTTEFVPSEHTPKNRIIMGERRGNYFLPAITEYKELKKTFANNGIILENYLNDDVKELISCNN